MIKPAFLKVSVLAIVLTGTSCCLTNCGNTGDGEETKMPAIISFSPDSGPVGTTVTIHGTNFSPTISTNVVRFNGDVATVTAASTTSLTATVPEGATTGLITVFVNDASDTSAAEFVVSPTLPVPVITSIEPLFGLPGTTITITGTNFSSTAANNIVRFTNNISAVVSEATATSMSVIVPEGATTGKVKVTVNGETGKSEDSFEVLKNIPTEGLVAFYPFKGNANDATDNHLHGTLMNGPVPAEDRFGKENQSYFFDGEDDYITIGNPTLLQISNQITVSGWINVPVVEDQVYVVTKIFSNPDMGNNPWRGYRVSLRNLSSVPGFRLTLYSASESEVTSFLNFLVGETPLPMNTWIFFAVVIDTNTYRFYQDGEMITEMTSGEDIMNNGTQGDLVFGGGSGNKFEGRIDDIAIYNRSLTDEEIVQLYEQTASKY